MRTRIKDKWFSTSLGATGVVVATLGLVDVNALLRLLDSDLLPL